MAIGAILGASVLLAAAQPACTVQSAAARVAVVELYTSQGCSSCPPADRWLSQLPAHYATDKMVPLAFHVDYWDDLGWKDPFARPEFSRRQRQLAARGSTSSIYTPEVYIDGHEVRDWSNSRTAARVIDAANAAPAPVRIDLTLEPSATPQEIHVTARVNGGTASAGAAATPPVDLVLALTQSGHLTAVGAGENRGERLRDDHVVRDWQRERVAGGAPVRRDLALPADGPREFTLVALAYEATTGELLQALAFPVGDCAALPRP
jgi:hypothetical protein